MFAFGAPFTGSVADQALPAPVVGITRTPDGLGAWIVTADGSVYGFGLSRFFGTPPDLPPPPDPPDLSVTTVASGLTIPWDMAFTPDGALLFDERDGKISVLAGGATRTIATVASVHSDKEMGLLGLTLDPDFATTRAFYTCYVNESPRDERVTRWTVNGDYTLATEDPTPLLVGIPAENPTHNGCRVRVGPDGYLWIGTGDSLLPETPQDPNSFAGKVLRIDRHTGAAAPGNPFGTPVFTIGHRNVEGLVFRPGTDQAYSIEHGTFRDDEVNLLTPGANYGWDPSGWADDEAPPMTDFDRHPDAVGAVWHSRNPTLATSGATFLEGDQWGTWNGVLAIACLKATQIHLIWLDAAGHPVTEASAVTGFGRLRTPVQGPDGALYIATSNGSGNDLIIRVAPQSLVDDLSLTG